MRIAVVRSARIGGSRNEGEEEGSKKTERCRGKRWEDERPVDQTESNNSRGITTLAHENRSYPEEMVGTRHGVERVKWRHSRGRKKGQVWEGGSSGREK